MTAAIEQYFTKNGESAEELFCNAAVLYLWLQPLKNSCQGVHFQVACFQPATLLKNKFLYRCFSMVLTAGEEQFSIFTSLDGFLFMSIYQHAFIHFILGFLE